MKQPHIFTINRMEVWGWMITKKQFYNNAIKSRNFRHIVSRTDVATIF